MPSSVRQAWKVLYTYIFNKALGLIFMVHCESLWRETGHTHWFMVIDSDPYPQWLSCQTFQFSPLPCPNTPRLFWVHSFPLCHQVSKEVAVPLHRGEVEQREGSRHIFTAILFLVPTFPKSYLQWASEMHLSRLELGLGWEPCWVFRSLAQGHKTEMTHVFAQTFYVLWG